MYTISKILLSTLLLSLATGCATTSTKRAAYEGADQVGAIDFGMMVGTWQMQVINPRESDPPTEGQLTINADGSTSGFASADLTAKDLDVVVYDIAGNWSVNGDTINQKLDSVKQSAGTPFAAFGVGLSMGLMQGQTTVTDVYEASANHFVIVNDKGVARRYTRVN